MQRRTYLALAATGVGAMAGCTSDTTTDSSGGDGDGGGDSTPVKLTHELNESFTVGSGDKAIEYTATDVSTYSNIGGQYGEDADGIFLVVILEMENVGDESFDISDRHLSVIDDQDREFDADFGAGAYVETDDRIGEEGITYEQLNPGLSITRAVIFDVSPGASYQLKIAPVGFFSTADRHFVELGEVTEE